MRAPRLPDTTQRLGSRGIASPALFAHWQSLPGYGTRRDMSSSTVRSLGQGAFSGTTLAELQAWLSSASVDSSAYGRGVAKSLQELLAEVYFPQALLPPTYGWSVVASLQTQKGESLLLRVEEQAVRNLRILNIFVTSEDGERVLIEDYQVRPNGVKRQRCLPLSEKLLPQENWRDGTRRAVLEELGSALTPGSAIYLQDSSHETSEAQWVSTSYPGLQSWSKNELVDVTIPELPQEGSFSTFETRTEGVLESRWTWVPKEWREEFRRKQKLEQE